MGPSLNRLYDPETPFKSPIRPWYHIQIKHTTLGPPLNHKYDLETLSNHLNDSGPSFNRLFDPETPFKSPIRPWYPLYVPGTPFESYVRPWYLLQNTYTALGPPLIHL